MIKLTPLSVAPPQQDEPEIELDPDAWVICPNCEGDGKHSKHLGDFTMSEFHEHFEDPDDREAYFAGAYDTRCNPCHGTGKIKRRDLDDVAGEYQRELERDRIARTGRNSAGEPCW
jgi:DnaJ-class molecular chaperone